MNEQNWCEIRFRVRYAETDAAGIVHHATYPVWFEEGRSELSRQLGMPYAGLEPIGVDLVLSVLQVRYRAPARYDEEIRVLTRVAGLRSRTMAFEYRVLRAADGTLLAEGRTDHVAVNRVSGHPTRIPAPFLEAWGRNLSDLGSRPSSESGANIGEGSG